MKKVIFVILLIGLQISLFAQDNTLINVKRDLPLTYANIAKKAADKWPGDYEMQKYTIDNQCESYNEYRTLRKKYSVPEDVYVQVMMTALDKWCDNDWVNCVKENKEVGLDAMHACWGADWEMVVYTMKNQFDAYNSLQK